ncbi:hypothetical protein BD309DRAFT_967472 [Dichomitus squalens]|nr:hypothetical protein BD309DRAFT_967472 [Dichomitus squalens]
MERLVVGIERVRAHHAAFAVAVPTLDPLPHHQGMDGAHARLRCLTGASQLWATMVPKLLLGTNDASVIPPGREPLEEWAGVVPNVAGQCARHGVCADCGRAIVARIEAFRREFWAKLPQFFELV